MNTDKATVTIPYLEFEKHQDQVKEIEEARKINEKLKKGELVHKHDYNKVLNLILCYHEYMNHVLHTKNTTSDTVSIYEFAKQKGVEVDRDNNLNYIFKISKEE